MNAKIYICKQRDYVTWFTATLFFVVAYLIVVMVDNINKTMLWGGALLISLGSTVYFYGKYKMRNELMRNDERGNMLHGPLNGAMGDYTYDCRNRLIETKAADGTVTAYG